MNDEQWKLIYDGCLRAAKRVSLSWPENVEYEDLAHDMVVHFLERPGALARLVEEDAATRAAFLIKVGHQVASKQQIDFDHYSCNFLYSTFDVREMLDKGLLTDNESENPAKLDLVEALDNLKGSTHYAEIVNRWIHEIKPGRQDSAAHSRIGRAVEALTERMNRIGADRRSDYQGPGSRKAMSNSMSEFVLATQGDESIESKGGWLG